MPNMKIYVDRSLPEQSHQGIQAALVPLSELLCERLDVNINACQFAVIAVYAMADLPAVNVELSILPKVERSHQKLVELAKEMQQLIGDAAGTHVAARISQLDPSTFIALK